MNPLMAFIIVITSVILILLGWDLSALSVAEGCDKLGSFHVGSKVYTCELKR